LRNLDATEPLSVDDTKIMIDSLKTNFPSIVKPKLKDICYATQNRENALRELTRIVDILLAIGAANSSNSSRLCEIGSERGVPSYFIEDAAALDLAWLSGVNTVGMTAGGSAPDYLVQELIETLRQYGDVEVSAITGFNETIRFSLPLSLGLDHDIHSDSRCKIALST
jgi:4-hydroxy-3-methylbut-2-en-1-yl diphosphate reductase